MRRVQVQRTRPTKKVAPRKGAGNFLVTSLLIGGLALGSAAAFEYVCVSSHFVVHGHVAAGAPVTQSPWMY
jgi:hypothetical protein